MKLLALLSGGLDSTLALKIAQNLGFEVEAVHFSTPFCRCDSCSVNAGAQQFGVKVSHVFLGQEFLDLVVDPPHGRGSQMNICLDCRILMLRKAKELSREIGAQFLVTGEVLDERPFSQRLHSMMLIEREAGVEGMVLRPLSGRLLPDTELEKMGLVRKEDLYSIHGRRRLPQFQLAEEFGLKDYPCPSGGCLLTDPAFAKRLREHLAHERRLTIRDAILLTLGRHFRVGSAKIVVGRNEQENDALLAIAERDEVPLMSVVDYMGPNTLIIGSTDQDTMKTAAAITVRYSDAPKDGPTEVKCSKMNLGSLFIEAIGDDGFNKILV